MFITLIQQPGINLIICMPLWKEGLGTLKFVKVMDRSVVTFLPEYIAVVQIIVISGFQVQM